MGDLGVRETILETTSDGEPMAVLRKRPSSAGPHRKVVVFHDAPGIRGATHAFCRRLAGRGYDVIVPDLHHRHGRLIGFSPADVADDPAAQPRIRELLAALTDDGIQQDLDAALDAVGVRRPSTGHGEPVEPGADRPERIHGIGFCIGARAVFRTMMRLPEQFEAGAMWHPSYLVDDSDRSPHLTAGELPGSLYAGFGEADRLMSVASMRPFISAVAVAGNRVEIDVLPGADHGYTWPDSPSHNEDAADQAWSRTLALFQRTDAHDRPAR